MPVFHLAPEIYEGTPANIHTSYPSEKATGDKGRRQRQSVKVIRFGLSVHVGGVEPLHGLSHSHQSRRPIIRSPSSSKEPKHAGILDKVQYTTLDRGLPFIHIYPFSTNPSSLITRSLDRLSQASSPVDSKDGAGSENEPINPTYWLLTFSPSTSRLNTASRHQSSRISRPAGNRQSTGIEEAAGKDI